jgi:beta-aspartyl-peptidase (threonine type)
VTAARVVVHGGVDTPSTPEVLDALERAARAGADAIDVSGDPVEGVEAAVRVLEDAPMLNAGYGSVLNRDGEVEADASVVDATAGRCASVGALRGTEHPVSVAAELLRQTPGPVLLVAEGAERFARALRHPTRDLRAPERIRAWERIQAGDAGYSPFTGRVHSPADTVGAIAVAPDGRLAVASSTGGLMMKLPGRVGDAAVFGAGIYGDARVAVLCSGVGEAAIQLSLSIRTALRYQEGRDANEAVTWAVEHVGARSAIGGVILVDRETDPVAVAHNADVFPVVSLDPAGIRLVPPVPTNG